MNFANFEAKRAQNTLFDIFHFRVSTIKLLKSLYPNVQAVDGGGGGGEERRGPRTRPDWAPIQDLLQVQV